MARTFLISVLSIVLIVPPVAAEPPEICLPDMNLIAQIGGPEAKIKEVAKQEAPQAVLGPLKVNEAPDHLAQTEQQNVILQVPKDFLTDHYKEITAQDPIAHVAVTGTILVGAYVLYRLGGGHRRGETAAIHLQNAERLQDSQEVKDHAQAVADYQKALEAYENALIHASPEAFNKWVDSVKQLGLSPVQMNRALPYVRYIRKSRTREEHAKKKTPEEAEEYAIRKMSPEEFEAWAAAQEDAAKITAMETARREKGPVPEEDVPLEITAAQTALEAQIQNVETAQKAVHDKAKTLNIDIGKPEVPFANTETPIEGAYAHHPRYFLHVNQNLQKAIEAFHESWRLAAEGPGRNTRDYGTIWEPWYYPYNLFVALPVNIFRHGIAMFRSRDLPPWIPPQYERGLFGWNYVGRFGHNLASVAGGILKDLGHIIGVKGGTLLAASAMALIAYVLNDKKDDMESAILTGKQADDAKRMDPEQAFRNEVPSANEMLFSFVHMWATMKRQYPEFPDFPFNFADSPEQHEHLKKLYDQALEAENIEREKNPGAYTTDRVFKVEVARRFLVAALSFAQKDLGLKLEDEALFGPEGDGRGGLTDNFSVAYPDALAVSMHALQRLEHNRINLRKLMEGQDFKKAFEALLKQQEILAEEGKIDPATALKPADFELLREFSGLNEEKKD